MHHLAASSDPPCQRCCSSSILQMGRLRFREGLWLACGTTKIKARSVSNEEPSGAALTLPFPCSPNPHWTESDLILKGPPGQAQASSSIANPTCFVSTLGFLLWGALHSGPARGLGSRVAAVSPGVVPRDRLCSGRWWPTKVHSWLIDLSLGGADGSPARRPGRRSQWPVSNDRRKPLQPT